MRNLVVLFVFGILCFACTNKPNSMVLIPEGNFNEIIDGKQVKLFTLKNKDGIVSQVTNYGGRVVSLWVPDKEGQLEDIVLGYETIDGYLNSNEIYFGALIGRYGNRINQGKFKLNDQEYSLATNNETNHLHGGIKGFNNVVWNTEQLNDQTLRLTYLSKDMEEGYPGNLKVKVSYTLTDNNELKIEYWATTDKPTVVNLTHHSFFNLHGAGNGSINDHHLMINADNYTPVKQGLIPTGEILSVNNTPMDFTEAIAIGERLNHDYKQLEYGFGYDHNWVLNKTDKGLNLAAKISEPQSGRTIEVYTNEPGLQFYGGNFLNGDDIGKLGKKYNYRTAFCLETQHFPDSPNHNNFPSTVLTPNEEYHSVCIYKFNIEK
ncbi:galactose mutarotase [Sabulilitoribacter arenilitoris]|uniref:Aldose 1-epimerase n=1 Tax=Wocania arenilitoris TaxID=2044858 RepID=A0AAE3JNH3_9FLAO|nr:aldose epimerase family protein [Wocania arenilitoris]MCF7567265.1 galactose mutarotase [Wocania arenilitoris]